MPKILSSSTITIILYSIGGVGGGGGGQNAPLKEWFLSLSVIRDTLYC